MGVLYDYFRAADDAAVHALIAANAGGPILGGVGPEVDGVDAKSIDPAVCLGQLVAYALGVDWEPDLVGDDLIWSSEVDDGQHGPWVAVLGDPARDTLAAVPADRMPELATRWAAIEEFDDGHTTAETLLPVLRDLVGLAARARTAGDHLYCWIRL